MFNWISIFEENDLTYLSKSGKLYDDSKLVYKDMTRQLIDVTGVSKNYENILNNQLKIELLTTQQLLAGGISKQTFIDILKHKTEELEGRHNKADLYHTVMSIEQNMGFRLNPRELTVFEFYKYIDFLSTKNGG